jgi:predicted metal-dependent HD superfamily phosphohydrolase
MAYETQVREECSAMNDEAYRTQRIAWLQGFIDRPMIYESETMREIYEDQARFNLEQRIEQLQRV